MHKIDTTREEQSYDEDPYESYPISQAHPSRIAAIAKIYGLAPPPIENARILELGCAAGGHLIPLAWQYPSAHFLGIDLSGVHIKEGSQRIANLGLSNISLRKASISDISPSDGLFDYILTHGVYSWVPPAIRSAILRVSEENLSHNGVAYMSYNTLPGWHLKAVIRDIMRFHQAHTQDSPWSMESTRKVLSIIQTAISASYGAVMAQEMQIALNSKDFFLKHDFLERWNSPLYLSEFLAEAKGHGLGYLSDADLYGTISERYDPVQIRNLQHISQNDPLLFEQYLDFYTGRMFRMSLLVKEAQLPLVRYTPLESAFDELYFCSVPLHIKDSVEEANPIAAIFSEIEDACNKHAEDFSDFPIIARAIAFFLRSSQQAGRTVTLNEVIQASCVGEPTLQDRNDIRDLIVEMFRQRMLSFYTNHLGYTSDLQRPCAFPLARLDAEQGRSFTSNPFHQRVDLDTNDRLLLPLLDGTQDQARLALAIQRSMTSAQSHEVLTQMLHRYRQLNLL